MNDGESVALVSDAGTPAISDPGARLVARVRAAGHRVIPLPGPCAAIAALSASGLTDPHFLFYGFLPAKSRQREDALREVGGLPYALVFYEAPHRIGAMLEDLREAFGEREVVVARELTKLHEELVRGTVAEVAAKLTSERHRGEFVVVVEGATDRGANSDADAIPARDRVAALEAEGLSRMDAVKRVAKEQGVPKREVYREVVGDGVDDT